ncbi:MULTISPECIES: alpha/beta fold hydrolase [unclassified Roseateles]|uniref:alpha/beta fold hydrolase n=1 Tax=unclassified Roseateles TaxID=2626991 RepID=UPI0006F9CB5A|nr:MULTISPECIES: alpha/beta hydrolase [unclassified Roseateles]KQW45305.1 chloroperoxidase [Pelomonas sp. Root405]KRA72150.1 chloroperoxidase [Pelomonas sp. Root662]
MHSISRLVLTSAIAVGSVGVQLQSASAATPSRPPQAAASQYVAAADGTPLYVKDWGPRNGAVVVFSHGWPLNADSWESQMQFLAEKGMRVIAHDRRGHGRSGQPWAGNNIDQYADDLDTVLRSLDVKRVTLVGFSTGGGEVARYIGRHGTARVAKTVLVGAITPIMGQTPTNPNGVPTAVFDSLRKASLENRAQLYKDIAGGPFFGFNRPGAKASAGLADSFYVQGMQASSKATYDCIDAFFYSDFRDDLKKFDVPTLVIHGADDQIVPIETTGRATARLVKGARLIEYADGPHGITDTHKDRLNQDLLAFVRG